MGIGFRILLVKKKTIVNILTDFLYRENQSKTKKELKKILTTWSEPYFFFFFFLIKVNPYFTQYSLSCEN